VPLLLFALAVEIAEGQVFRSTWDQVVAADLPTRLGGLAAALAPRAGPELTQDALGLLFSALAGALAIAYLTVGMAGVGRRVRLGLLALAGVLVVAVPLLVMVKVGDRTGLIRAQDPVVVQSAGDARRLASARSPYTQPPEDSPRGREAYAISFRLEPPVEIRPDRPNMPPGPSVLATLGRTVGRRDVRLWGLLALALLAALVARRGEPGNRVAATGLTLLLAPLALGTVLGALVVLALLGLLGAWALARQGPPWAAGLLTGLAVAADHRAALLAPLVLLPLADRPRAGRAALAGGALAYGAVVLPVAVLDLPAFVARLLTLPGPGAGLGVFNLFAYSGAEASTAARTLAALTPFAALLLTAALLRRREPPLALAGLAALAWVALAPTLSPDTVAVPILLLGLSALLSHSEELHPRPGDEEFTTR
jgi:hypothetical protein